MFWFFAAIPLQMPVGPIIPAPSEIQILSPSLAIISDVRGIVRSDDQMRFGISCDEALKQYYLAKSHLDWLKSLEWNQTRNNLGYREIIAHQKNLVSLYWELHCALGNCCIESKVNTLLTIRQRIGEESYYAGVLPPPVIVWEFQGGATDE